MARIDDYTKAVELGKKDLEGREPNRIAVLGGAAFEVDSGNGAVVTLDFLNRKVAITWPDLDFSFEGSDEEVPIQQQVLLLHYLNGAKGLAPQGEWIAYQEIPDGKFYLDAFLRRAKAPMVQAFGDRPELLVELAEEAYNTTPFDHGDFSVVVQALPVVPVALILWKGDDEFPSEGNILFDRTISDILSAEDIAWLAGMIVYPLVGMKRNS
ncbi:MAG: DUF3786 domain-containing protein [Thermodesulfobacteriota bacterium]|nr:DUF3786 domain-containing protein [Thermodesulfobacteriota bacterium]